jgi:rod shape-determining protein MreB
MFDFFTKIKGQLFGLHFLLRNKISYFRDNFFFSVIGVDLGTSNTLIYIKSKGVVMNEPSFVAYTSDNGIDIGYLYGNKAKMMVGKTPIKINVISPLADGVICDFHMAEDMLRKFISSVIKFNPMFRPIAITGVPLNSTPVEKRSIQEAIDKCGVKDTYLVHESIAAAIGANLPINQPHGCMVVDIGGGTTEISIISLGGIVKGKSIKVGGNTLDKVILEYIKNKYHLLIGEYTAEEVKKAIGIAYIKPNEEQKQILVKGRDLRTHTPEQIYVSESDIIVAISEPIHQIIVAIKEILETSPPELASDIVDRGIVLCGGGSYIKNLDYVISEAFMLPVFVPNKPELCVINGIGVIAENYKQYDHILFKQM